jgi:protein-L-isoaspartate O-methyltransferase
MVRALVDEGAIVSDPVAAAFGTVPRHLFAPGEALEAAYAALIAELAGPGGQVTTVDIDPDVTGRAREGLGAADTSRCGWCWWCWWSHCGYEA